jgi:S1-C subfamily serine protease
MGNNKIKKATTSRLGIAVIILGAISVIAVVSFIARLALTSRPLPEEPTKAQGQATHAAAVTPAKSPTRTKRSTPTMTFRRALIQAQQATVAIGVVVEEITCDAIASGTVVDPKGLIVTSAHVLNEHDSYCIACARVPGNQPYWCYNARVIKQDDVLDLALLSVESRVDGSPIGKRLLIAVPMGDSNEVRTGDTIYVLGYPHVGGSSVTVTQGLVSGFEENRTLIKTDAEISSGSSGGAAINENGLLIGISMKVRVQDTGKIGYLVAVNEVRRFLR